MEVDNDVNGSGGEFVIYLDEDDISTIMNDYVVGKTEIIPDTKQTIDLTVSFDGNTNINNTDEEHFDSAMEALEVFFRAFIVSDLDTTVQELFNNNALEIQKALSTYRHYKEMKNKYE
jgi:exosome complex RNA-binding protein Rrp4